MGDRELYRWVFSGARRHGLLLTAFLRGPPILLLDEPTSTLDERSESEVCSRSLRLDAGRAGVRVLPLEVQ